MPSRTLPCPAARYSQVEGKEQSVHGSSEVTRSAFERSNSVPAMHGRALTTELAEDPNRVATTTTNWAIDQNHSEPGPKMAESIQVVKLSPLRPSDPGLKRALTVVRIERPPSARRGWPVLPGSRRRDSSGAAGSAVTRPSSGRRAGLGSWATGATATVVETMLVRIGRLPSNAVHRGLRFGMGNQTPCDFFEPS